MAPLSGEWLEALKGEFHQSYYAKIIQNSNARIISQEVIFLLQKICLMHFILHRSVR